MKLSLTARAFIALIVIAGAGVLGYAIPHSQEIHGARFLVFLVVTCVAARLKVKLPGLPGSMSVNLPFILAALMELSLAEALVVGCLSNLVQCLPRPEERFFWIQAAFNFNAMALAIAATNWIYGGAHFADRPLSSVLRLLVAVAGFFLVNTTLVAMIMALAEDKAVLRTWAGIVELTFPYFLLSGSVTAVAYMLADSEPLVILALMVVVFTSYRRYFARLAQDPTGVSRLVPSQSATTEAAKIYVHRRPGLPDQPLTQSKR
jgi:hypothetical protein